MPDDRANQTSQEPAEAAGNRFERAARSSRSPHGAAYEGAMEAIFAILISIGLGYWADTYFETEPVWLIVGAVVGFAAFVLRLLRLNSLVQETSAAAETQPQRSVAERSQGNETILGGTDRRPSDDEERTSESGDAHRVDL